jgi:N-acetyl-anhydromuramyl-L-alanine amidase AmpD
MHHTVGARHSEMNADRMYDHYDRSTPYHFIISSNGTIYEGRPLGILGDHVNRANTGRIGIAWTGNFETNGSMPTQVELDAAEWLINDLKRQYPTITTVQAHSHVNSGNGDFALNQTMLDWIAGFN